MSPDSPSEMQPRAAWALDLQRGSLTRDSADVTCPHHDPLPPLYFWFLLPLCYFDGYLKETMAALWSFNWSVGNPFCLSLSTSAPEQGEHIFAGTPRPWILDRIWGTVMEPFWKPRSHWLPVLMSAPAKLLQTPRLTSPPYCDGCTARDTQPPEPVEDVSFCWGLIRKPLPFWK